MKPDTLKRFTLFRRRKEGGASVDEFFVQGSDTPVHVAQAATILERVPTCFSKGAWTQLRNEGFRPWLFWFQSPEENILEEYLQIRRGTAIIGNWNYTRQMALMAVKDGVRRIYCRSSNSIDATCRFMLLDEIQTVNQIVPFLSKQFLVEAALRDVTEGGEEGTHYHVDEVRMANLRFQLESKNALQGEYSGMQQKLAFS